LLKSDNCQTQGSQTSEKIQNFCVFSNYFTPIEIISKVNYFSEGEGREGVGRFTDQYFEFVFQLGKIPANCYYINNLNLSLWQHLLIRSDPFVEGIC